MSEIVWPSYILGWYIVGGYVYLFTFSWCTSPQIISTYQCNMPFDTHLRFFKGFPLPKALSKKMQGAKDWFARHLAVKNGTPLKGTNAPLQAKESERFDFYWKAIWPKRSQTSTKRHSSIMRGPTTRVYNMVYNSTWLWNRSYHLSGILGYWPMMTPWPHWGLPPPARSFAVASSAAESSLHNSWALSFQEVRRTPTRQCNFIHLWQVDHLRAKPS